MDLDALCRAFESLALAKRNRLRMDTNFQSQVPGTPDLEKNIRAKTQSTNIRAKTLTTTALRMFDTSFLSKPISREMTPTAASRVLGTTELLENILIQNVSTADITRARQISKFFQDVIDTSPSLRRVMFLDPEPAREIIMSAHAKEFQLWDAGIHNPGEGDLKKDDYLPLKVTSLHPALEPPPLEWSPPDDNGYKVYSIYDGLLDNGLFIDPERFIVRIPDTKNWTPSGMWREMLLCQPPCAKPMAIVVTDMLNDGVEGRFYLREEGLSYLGDDRVLEDCTLGSLVDLGEDLGVVSGDGKCTIAVLSLSGNVEEGSRKVVKERAKRERDVAKAAWAAAGDKLEKGKNKRMLED